jgi:hypothetical protein
LLDRKRNKLYLSADDHIDVFSLATQQFLAPFTPPALNGLKAFYSLALRPDNSELLAANLPDGSLALINPDQPASATAVQVIPPGTSGNPGPQRIAATNTGKVFIAAMASREEGCGNSFYELDLATLKVSTVFVSGFCIQPEGFPLAASGDGSEVLASTRDISGAQQVAIYNAASGTWSSNNAVWEYFGGNAAVSIDGSVFATGSGMVDASADLLGSLAEPDALQSPGPYPSLPLEKVPDGGSLVYIPYANYTEFNVNGPSCVDIFDANHGELLHRINLAEQIQQATDAMEIDSAGQNIYLITNAGLTIVQLSNAPLSIERLAPSTGPVGTAVTIHGSGFVQGTAVSSNGVAVTSSYVDPNTLQATIPGVVSGSLQLTVTSPSGHSHSLDNAFNQQ